ncbi:zinc finger, CCHC-type containing protein [Tanacetum coccineum]
MPELIEDATVEAIRIRAKWENDDYIYRGHIMNGMSDLLLMNIRIMICFGPLGSHLRIEESLRRMKQCQGQGKEVGPSVNMTERLRITQQTTKVKSVPMRKRVVLVPNKNQRWNVGRVAILEFQKGLGRSGKKNNAIGGSGKGSKDQSQDQESRDAIFDENRFSSIPRPKDIIPNMQEPQMDDHTDDVPNEILEPRRGKRAKKANQCIEEDPRTYNEAMQSRGCCFLEEANDDKIGSIMENNTWVLSDLSPGCKSLGCKWIFKRKMKVDGIIDKFKARLVIQGFRQKEGIDYFDTYAPVACITTIRLYMKQPEGFVMPGNEHKVCKLVKSLYGLKQAPKQWHQKFDEVVLSSGFYLNQSDKCVYSKFDNSGKGVIICLYVDDMLIFRTDQNQVDKTKKFLSSKFSMKYMGEADVILGIKIKRENKGIVITQSHYIEKILKKFNREDCSPVSTPMDPVEKLKPNTGKPVDQLEYSRAIGCLMYAMTSTRPDIAYAVGRLSRFTSNPSRQHWKAITRVFKYLRGTKDYGLSYVGYPSVLEGYSDASWINHVEDSSSTSGWFVALAAAGKEAEWLRNLIHEIPIWPKPIAPISIRCDSAPTMAKAYSQIYNGKSRHLGVRHSMIRELIMNGVISIEFVRSQKNLADHLTL